MTSYSSVISEVLHSLPPGDATENTTRQRALDLVASGAPLIRQAVNFPDPHLISYVLLTDGDRILLADHRKSGLWLPTGGHVDVGEHPRDAALREAQEELGIAGSLISPDPLFITLQKTKSATPHTDLSFWYVMHGAPDISYDWDPGEFHQIRWFTPGDIPLKQTDPNLPRFLSKLHRLGHLRFQESVT